jgi:hypothetical protein
MNGPRIDYPDWLASLDCEAFDSLADAAETMLSIHQALTNDGLSILDELLREQEDRQIETWAHYPSADCLDANTGAMFYYHAHDAADWQREEHGHFHLFIRADAEVDFSHLMAISMTAHGLPTALFTTNRWVTDESLLPAAELLEHRWEIARARPSWMVAQWLNTLVKLVYPYAAEVLQRRDRAIGMSGATPLTGERIQPEDRTIHILSEIRIDLMQILTSIQHELHARTATAAPAVSQTPSPVARMS